MDNLKKSYSTSGKIFILGEYAVLGGHPGIVTAVRPRFEMKALLCASEKQNGLEKHEGPSQAFHPQSPIARLNQWAVQVGCRPLQFEFIDPLQGAGGFGASTAQFAMAYQAYRDFRNGQAFREESGEILDDESGQGGWLQAWKLYRELMSDEAIIPSGVDLISQWQGSVQWIDPFQETCTDLWDGFDWSRLLVFSATGQPGRKIPTHHHLKELVENGFPRSAQKWLKELSEDVSRGFSAIRENHAVELGKAMDHFAEILHREGLEAPATFEDRKTLRSLQGVCGVKGTGAFQSDAVLVLMETERGGSESSGLSMSSEFELNCKNVIRVAESRGLRWVCSGLSREKGILCQS